MTTTWDVIVVGAGLAGLTAGATAAGAGAATLVVDTGRPGGRARTTERDGFVFNLGAHAFYLGGEGAAVMSELGIPLVGSKPPLQRYKLLAGGELHAFPSGPTSLLRTSALSARSKATLAKLLAFLPRMDPAAYAGQSVSDWLDEQGLRADARGVLEALTRIGTYTARLDLLSAEAAILQLQRGAASGVLYLDGGWQQLIDGLRSLVEVRTRSAVRAVQGDGHAIEVTTDDAVLRARTVVLAAGTPAAVRALLPSDPGWGDLGEPVTSAVLDLAVRGVPSPGWVLGVEEPVYGTTQSPPARQAPPGDSVVSVLRYGARAADLDRPQLEQWARLVGVNEENVVSKRFLAHMVVTGAMPLARAGGFAGRPSIGATGMRNAFLAGDWVGGQGLLADASIASGHAAGLAAARAVQRSTTMVA